MNSVGMPTEEVSQLLKLDFSEKTGIRFQLLKKIEDGSPPLECRRSVAVFLKPNFQPHFQKGPHHDPE